MTSHDQSLSHEIFIALDQLTIVLQHVDNRQHRRGYLKQPEHTAVDPALGPEQVNSGITGGFEGQGARASPATFPS